MTKESSKGRTKTSGATGSIQGSRRRAPVKVEQQKKRRATGDVNANFGGAGAAKHKGGGKAHRTAQRDGRPAPKPSHDRPAPGKPSHGRPAPKAPALSLPKDPLVRGGIVAAAVLAAVALVCVLLGFATAGVGKVSQTGTASVAGDTEEVPVAEASVSFCAVGSNIANESILKSADAWGGSTGDGVYDFSPLYERMTGIVSQYDISFINQATTLGGNSGFSYQGYPSYNTPDTMADAIANAGFDVVNTNTNHTYDLWVDAIEHSQSVWAKHPEVTTIGSYSSEDDRANIRTIDKNGMKIAFLSYCYGQNGYTTADLPNKYYSAVFDKEVMRKEVEKAKELADAVVVYMQWNETDVESGSQDPTVLSDEQGNYASFLAGLGVDLLIGCRGQSIQPVTYVGRGIRTTDGSGITAQNGMLCVYGLGDFASAYTLPSAVLSGMFTCDFVRDSSDEVSVENPCWHPLLEHRSANMDCVYPLSDYTAELASSNELLARLNEVTGTNVDPLQWARDTTAKMVGDAIEVA